MKKICLLIFLLFLVFFAKPVFAFNFPHKQRKIVVFRRETLPQDQEKTFSQFNIETFKSFRLINARAAVLSSQQVKWLEKDPRVLRIDPDVEVYALPRQDLCERYPWLPWCPKPTPTLSPSPTPTSTPTSTPTIIPTPSPAGPTPTPIPTSIPDFQPISWGLAKINADDAWSIATGSGVRVAVLDTGIDTDHPDLDDNLVGCENFIYSWRTCEDDNGHGTHVSGIIAAENNDFGVVGVAPGAKIYSLKVLDRRGRGYLSDILEALDWAIDNDVQVVNMSFGTSSDVTSFREAVERINTAGIVQVGAVGNSGPASNSVLFPARYPQVIAVAATDSNNNIPSWSSRGLEVDLAAPGASIYSTYRRGRYKTMSGTSMSAPHVAGVAALRLENHPGESPTTIETILQDNAISLPFDQTLVGAGLVNAYNVVVAP